MYLQSDSPTVVDLDEDEDEEFYSLTLSAQEHNHVVRNIVASTSDAAEIKRAFYIYIRSRPVGKW